MNKKILIIAVLFSSIIHAQGITKKALFLGNSYTFGNDLPQMVADIAASVGDELIFDSHTPGGYTLQQHWSDDISKQKINKGDWDFVVLQEQSQYPSFPLHQVESGVYPYATLLDDLINAKNPCAETVFYMTWGRKNGDAFNCSVWQPVCTYEGMDNLLNERYKVMAKTNNAILSPVGAVWRYVRENHPLIELYESDESHPSVLGTYLAACTFYTSLFRKDPALITFNPNLPEDEIQIIQNAVKTIVFNNKLEWHIGEYDPSAKFSHQISTNQVVFTNQSLNATVFNWNFGDGNTSTAVSPSHSYAATGTYTVKLIGREAIGCVDSTIKINYITVDVPVANFIASDTFTICPPLQVQFTNTSTFYKTILWNFGDGNTSTAANPSYSYAIPNDYTVTLTVTSAGGCTSTKQQLIRVLSNTVGNLSYNPITGCFPMQVNFAVTANNNVKYLWDFGDGNTLFTSDSTVGFNYQSPGFYVPKVILQDTQGCLTPLIGIDTIKIFGSKPDFSVDKKVLCDNGTIQFRDSSVTADIVSSYVWNFGDGSPSVTSNTAKIAHNFTTVGMFKVSLVAIDSSTCNIADTAYFNVDILLNDSLDAQFFIPPYDPCTDSLTIFLNFTGFPLISTSLKVMFTASILIESIAEITLNS